MTNKIPYSDSVTDYKSVKEFIEKYRKFMTSKKAYKKILSDKGNCYRLNAKQDKHA